MLNNFITYFSLIITGLLAILGLFLNTTKADEKNANLKKLTRPGWIVLTIMLISLTTSMVAEYFKGVDDARSKIAAEKKSQEDGARISQLLKETGEDTLKLKLLESASDNIRSSQDSEIVSLKYAGAKADELDRYLRAQLTAEETAIKKGSDPLRDFTVNYTIVIPRDQQALKGFCDRIKNQLDEDHMFSSPDTCMPRLKDPAEYTLANFIRELSVIITFSKYKTNNRDSASLRLSGDSFIQFPTDKDGPKYGIFSYDASRRNFLLTSSLSGKTQETTNGMLSMADFAGKFVIFEFFEASNIRYSVADVDFRTDDNRSLLFEKLRPFVSPDGDDEYKKFWARIQSDEAFH